jgi:hypothetical protein
VPELPSVSALVAAYNYADFLPGTLDSALEQDYPPELLEVVVIDDGSSDATPEVLAEYEARHPGRVRAIRQDNAGYVEATNHAMREARGELLAILDADDLWPAHKTRTQVELLQRRPEVGLVYSDTEIIDPYDAVRYPSFWKWIGFKGQRGDAFAEIMGPAGNVALASSIMMRAELAEAYAPIPPGVPYVDWWVTARVAQVAEIDYVDDLRIGYRMHGANLTLGATGPRRVRETLKSSEVRRRLLMAGAGDRLTVEELAHAYTAFLRAGLTAIREAGSAYIPLPPLLDGEREEGARLAAEAVEATLAGEWERAFRLRVAALAHDPYDAASQEWVRWLVEPAVAEMPLPGDLLAEARSWIVLAYADELLAEPRMIAAYAGAFGPDEDVTLAIEAVEIGEADAVAALQALLADQGLDGAGLPDLLVVPERGAATMVELERRAHAVFSRRPPRLVAPAFGPDRLAELQARVRAGAPTA